MLELNAAGVPTARDTFGPLGLLSCRTLGPTDSYSRFYLFDPTGNVVNRLNEGQGVTSSCLYDAYGKWADPNTTESTDPFGYQGQSGYYRDSETGLYLCTFRYYDPREGRWLTEDPIGYDGSVNLYGYCDGDPVDDQDPSGQRPGDWYPSRDAAGKQAVRDINPESIRTGTEFWGVLYRAKVGGATRYSYTSPQPGGAIASGGSVTYPAGTAFSGTYHTHGRFMRPSDDDFSRTDKQEQDAERAPGYLGTPLHRIKKYTPLPISAKNRSCRGKVTILGNTG